MYNETRFYFTGHKFEHRKVHAMRSYSRYWKIREHFCLCLCLLYQSLLRINSKSSSFITRVHFHLPYPPKGGRGFLCLAPVWNFRAVSLIPPFYISSFVPLPSPVALSVLSFSAFGPLSWLLFLETSISRKVGSWICFVFWPVRRWVFQLVVRLCAA